MHAGWPHSNYEFWNKHKKLWILRHLSKQEIDRLTLATPSQQWRWAFSVLRKCISNTFSTNLKCIAELVKDVSYDRNPSSTLNPHRSISDKSPLFIHHSKFVHFIVDTDFVRLHQDRNDRISRCRETSTCVLLYAAKTLVQGHLQILIP